MADIFISYTREDREWAEAFSKGFEAQGWSVWWDTRLAVGESFDEVIEDELGQARCVVVLWSKKSVKSMWVKTEAMEGQKRNILAPVLIEDVEQPLAFRLTHAADLSQWNQKESEHQFVELVRDIKKVLGPSLVSLPQTQIPAASAIVEKKPASSQVIDSLGEMAAAQKKNELSWPVKGISILLAVIVVFAGLMTAIQRGVFSIPKLGVAEVDTTSYAQELAGTEVGLEEESKIVDGLLEKHFSARGGKDKMSSIQTVIWRGSMEFAGINMPIVTRLKRPNKIRLDTDVPAMNVSLIQAFDGETAWFTNPLNGSDAPQKMLEEDEEKLRYQYAIDGAILMYVENGYRMTYAGEEMVKERLAHRIEVQLPDKKIKTFHLDAESFMEIKSTQEGKDPRTGEIGMITNYSSDYREIKGVMMAHQLNTEFNGEYIQAVQLDQIEVNRDIPDSVFTMPNQLQGDIPVSSGPRGFLKNVYLAK